jgi:hypothetical protein
MQRHIRTVLLLVFFAVLCSASAHAGKVALLLEEPYGFFGHLNPTGHSAIYLSDVCADTPVRLRRCDPGETGVVIARYSGIEGYDWVAMPLLPYLYAVTSPDQIPYRANKATVERLKEAYRRKYLTDILPDGPDHTNPKGHWRELMGSAYIRKIYGFSLEGSPEQDDALIAAFNDQKNHSHFNLFFNNCANFAEKVLNFYYPHSVHRSFVDDVGLVTPKQVAYSFQKYAKRHSDLEFTTFVIPQVPGSIHRSKPPHGVLEGLLETKMYSVPLAFLHPFVAGGMVAVYFGVGRFHPGAHIDTVFNPRTDAEPAMQVAAETELPTEQGNQETIQSVSYEYPDRGYPSFEYPGFDTSKTQVAPAAQ